MAVDARTMTLAPSVAVDPLATTAPSDAGATGFTIPNHAVGDRYQLLELIAEGGMGVVHRGIDTVLSREVALKLIHERHASKPDILQRFFEESRITGQLQHPGIPPVHDLGKLPDGRPFLAMKLIKGQTLSDLLKENLTLGRKLAIFESICQAVAYAHNKGVIHRDLKPANVMVGSFGETQVMDWGLAKIITDAKPESTEEQFTVGSILNNPREDSDHSTDTVAGSAIGTLAYMPPEQAIGAKSLVGPASDVFGLGAILCELLTGLPPYVPQKGESPHFLAATAKLEDAYARIEASEAEVELKSICCKCLSRDVTARYASAAELAKAIGDLRQASEARARQAAIDAVKRDADIAAAQQEAEFKASEAALVTRQAKQRRLFWAGLSFLLLIGALGVGVANLRLQKEKRLAERRLDLSIDAVERMMIRMAGEKWARDPALQDERREVLEEAIKVYQQFLDGESSEPLLLRKSAQAQFKIATLWIALGKPDKSREELEKAETIQQGLVNQFPEIPEYSEDLATTIGLLGHTHILEGRFEVARNYYQRMMRLGEALVQQFPERESSRETLIEGLNFMGNSWIGNPGEALKLFRRMLEESEKLMMLPTPSFSTRLNWITAVLNVGLLDKVAQNRAELVSNIRKGLDEIPKLAKEKPPSAHAADKLALLQSQQFQIEAELLMQSKKFVEARDSLKEGRKRLTQLLQSQPQNFLMRNQYLALTRGIWIIENQMKDAQNEEKSLEELITETDRLFRDYPKMTWILATSLTPRSVGLIAQIRAGKLDKVDAEIDFMNRAVAELPGLALKQVVDYNLACVYAQLFAKSDGETRTTNIRKAVEKLEILYKDNYFDEKVNLPHLDSDTDIDPIRKEPVYIEFRKKLGNLKKL
jgi:tetratricopeptide (TPR) repeat protein